MAKIWRPPSYTRDEFEDKVEAYLEERKLGKEKWPITLVDFCVFAEVYADYISEHDLGDKSPLDFSEAIKMLRTECRRSLEHYGLLGKVNPTMAIFLLKANHGYKEPTDPLFNLGAMGDVIVKLPEPPKQLNSWQSQ